MEVGRTNLNIKITDENNKSIKSSSVEANLLFIILDIFEDIKEIVSTLRR